MKSIFRRHFFLGVFFSFLFVLVTSCEPVGQLVNGLPNSGVNNDLIQINSINDIKAVWENNDYGHCEYGISESEIADDYMDCVFNIVSDELVVSSDGYSLIFTQCAKGTEWTPTGNYYVVAVKKHSDGSIEISCPIDYSQSYKSLEELKSVYTSEYGVLSNGNWTTKCTLMSGKTPQTILQDAPEGTVIATSYLSNFAGSYTLDTLNWELNVGAKINIHKSTNEYWNANVVNPTYDNLTKTYSFLLAHSSQKDASGSIDPGITGSEPFINQQGLFWSRMTLTAKTDAQWEIKWSSTWTSSMEDAANLTLDKTDSFTGPECPKITYTYKFYFGNPKLDTDGWYTVDKGSLIYETQFEADLPTDKTWKEIYEEYEIASKINLPEGKASDYWWYSTNSITGIENSYVYKLTDSYKSSLETYEFYLATKETSVTKEIYTNPGKFYNASKGYLEITETTIQWNDDVYTIVDGEQWSEAGKSTTNPKLPLQYCYLVSKDSKNYYCLVEYYVNNNFTYNSFRLPKETTDTECKTTGDFSLFNSRQANLYILKYYTRSAFWTSSDGGDYNGTGETSDNSGYCYFIVNNENSITWVTYPLIEDEEYGEEYRERQEYTLVKQSNGLWVLQEEISDEDSEDGNTSNVSMIDGTYVTGLTLNFDKSTISVNYEGYMKIKEWYTGVNSEPNTARTIW